jgi:hypothetical protein
VEQAHVDSVEISNNEDDEFDNARSNHSTHTHHHQGITVTLLSIILIYLLIIHRVLTTLGRYSNVTEPTIPSGRTRWSSI